MLQSTEVIHLRSTCQSTRALFMAVNVSCHKSCAFPLPCSLCAEVVMSLSSVHYDSCFRDIFGWGSWGANRWGNTHNSHWFQSEVGAYPCANSTSYHAGLGHLRCPSECILQDSCQCKERKLCINLIWPTFVRITPTARLHGLERKDLKCANIP